MSDFEKHIADIAERAMQGRQRMERSEVVARVLEALVVDVLERDPRFYRRASLYGLTARRESDELQRRRREEETAAASSTGEWTEAGTGLRPYGVPFGDAA
jgi:hypothetical protein